MFKKRIGITQRVMKHPRYNEVMDCLDINWASLLCSLGILPVPLPLIQADAASDVWKTLELDGLILSGGNTLVDYADVKNTTEGLCAERDAYEQALMKVALSTCAPILGVCRGMQVINIYYNGQLKKIKGHAGKRHCLIREDSAIGFNFPSEVNSFHDYAVPRKNLGQSLISLAHDVEDNIEALCNPKDKVLGIMWHPERENPTLQTDRELIKEHFGL
jgi:N5-(cytidine 5'-diphosphoramidyl)-L-glutamine hydrolase